jgi:hypothetical protein
LRTTTSTTQTTTHTQQNHNQPGDFATQPFIDPANSNNIISDDLIAAERRAIRAEAQAALSQKTWQEIVK